VIITQILTVVYMVILPESGKNNAQNSVNDILHVVIVKNSLEVGFIGEQASMDLGGTDVKQVAGDFYTLYNSFHLRRNEKKQIQRRDKSQRVRKKQKLRIFV